MICNLYRYIAAQTEYDETVRRMMAEKNNPMTVSALEGDWEYLRVLAFGAEAAGTMRRGPYRQRDDGLDEFDDADDDDEDERGELGMG